MRDRPLQALVKRGLAWLYLVGLARRRRRHPPVWDLGGACEGCGACCERPTIAVGGLVHMPVARALFVWWQHRVNGFVDAVVDVKAQTIGFRCTHFHATTRRCDSYESRPGMCRDYPRMLLHDVRPEFFERCGYRAVDGGADALLDALRARGVAASQLVTIERRLKGARQHTAQAQESAPG